MGWIIAGIVGALAVAAYVYRERQETAREKERTKRATVINPPPPEPAPAPREPVVTGPTPRPIPTGGLAAGEADDDPEPEPVLAGPDTIRVYVDGHQIPRKVGPRAVTLPAKEVHPGERFTVPIRFVLPAFDEEARAALLDALMRISNPSSYEAGAEIITRLSELLDEEREGERLEKSIRDQGHDVSFVERLSHRVLEGDLPGHRPVRLVTNDSSALGLRYWVAFTNEGDAVVEVSVPMEVAANASRDYMATFLIDFGNRGNMQWDAKLAIEVASA